MTEHPISHTRSATWMARENLGLFAVPGVDQGQGQSQCQGKDDAQGDASVRRPRHRLEGHKGRRQRETSRASPTKISARLPPRYPQVGKTVEGDEVEEGKVSYWRRLPDTHR